MQMRSYTKNDGINQSAMVTESLGIVSTAKNQSGKD